MVLFLEMIYLTGTYIDPFLVAYISINQHSYTAGPANGTISMAIFMKMYEHLPVE